MSAHPDVALFIDPFSHRFERDRLFEPETDAANGENILAPWVYLRDWFAERGIAVHTADRLPPNGGGRRTRNLFVSFGLRGRYRALAKRPDVILSAFFAFESPIVEPDLYRELPRVQRHFKRLYTFTDAGSLRPYLPTAIRSAEFRIPSPLTGVREDLWSNRDRRFLVMINHNKLPAARRNELYTERMRAVEFFARTDEIHLYGKGWDGPSYQMGIGWVPGRLQHLLRAVQGGLERLRPAPLLRAARRVYRGVVPSKLETLSRYTFSLCFENVVLNGWVTEKIFDCFAAGNIPVYWGAADIDRYVPSECFIDMRRFKNYTELRSFLRSLSAAEIEAYRNGGRAFLGSPAFRPFQKEAFVELVARLVEEDGGVQLERRVETSERIGAVALS